MTRASRDSSNTEYGLVDLEWPRNLRLPDRPPRLLYLDLNHWIGLARATLSPGSQGYGDVLATLRRCVAAGTVRVVLTGAIFREIAKIRDPKQKRALVSVVEDLTGFTYALSLADLFRLEVESSLSDRLGEPSNSAKTVDLLGQTAQRALGVPGDLRILRDGKDITEQMLGSSPGLAEQWPEIRRNVQRELLVGPADADIPGLREEGYRPEIPEATIVNNARFEAAWAEQIAPFHGEADIRDLVIARHLLQELLDYVVTALLARGRDTHEVVSERESARSFVLAMPASCAFVSLLAQHHRNPEHSWLQNDMYDLDALAVAIPYCDIVFTDAAARHAAVACGLDEHFQTFMPRRVRDLQNYLRSLQTEET